MFPKFLISVTYKLLLIRWDWFVFICIGCQHGGSGRRVPLTNCTCWQPPTHQRTSVLLRRRRRQLVVGWRTDWPPLSSTLATSRPDTLSRIVARRRSTDSDSPPTGSTRPTCVCATPRSAKSSPATPTCCSTRRSKPCERNELNCTQGRRSEKNSGGRLKGSEGETRIRVLLGIGVNPLVSTVSGHPQFLAFWRKGRGWREGKGKGGKEGGHSLIFTALTPLV